MTTAAKNYLSVLGTFLFFLFVTSCSSGDQSAAPNDAEKTVAPKKKVITELTEVTESAADESKVEEKSASADNLKNKGIGPIKHVEFGEIDQAMVADGAKIYKEKCTSCHKPDKRFIGPAPKGVFERRSPEWVMNMILNPEVMVKEDPIAKALLIEFNLSPMANQHLTEEEARKVVEYFRTL